MGKMIVLAGNVGAGKSTFTRVLSERLGFTPYYESVADNPFLEDFYKDQKKWSYHLQTFFLFHRFNSIKDIIDSGTDAILDRSIYEDAEIFAKNLYLTGKMSEREYKTYTQIFYTMLEFLKKPDLLIYIKTSVDTVVKRIAKRGREMEMQVPIEYWQQLDNLYKDWIDNYDESKIYVVDGDEIDIVENPEYIDKIVNDINEILNINEVDEVI
ncbi:deoxycytidine kinase [Marinitoga sp. 1135]|uniref:Deoxynucleoside kinase n=1 Tax=Marinitoga piezophila (strain DSM 14283 / JCM 11233 / KA3) TaxID=443254 RepID=H2J397_MARPK|nr:MULTISPECIES: deoxynucleoside kinase [Marinitoga]AEX84615.1 deoxynucleoside kinase [Marinitoga piezophila KA3]NUU94904.1 deoxycytidine kinase [Marinitoga sp. 1135]NUU96842.1 deoxycytidine kinase [Marinitoga sp. 1138]